MLHAAASLAHLFSRRCNLTAPSRRDRRILRHVPTPIPRRACDAILSRRSLANNCNATSSAAFLEPNGWTSIRVHLDFHFPRRRGSSQTSAPYDVSFSPASTELDATVIAARARAEGDIITFLMEWIGPIVEGDRDAVERFIREEHPGYAPSPSVSREEIQERVNEIARVHRVVETHGLRGQRARQERDVEL